MRLFRNRSFIFASMVNEKAGREFKLKIIWLKTYHLKMCTNFKVIFLIQRVRDLFIISN